MERETIVAAVAMLLLGAVVGVFYGSSGVSQEKFDQLSKKCESEKAELLAMAQAREGNVKELEGKLSDFSRKYEAMDALVTNLGELNQKLSADSSLLEKIVALNSQIKEHQVAISYYDDAYGPGQILNTAKALKIDAQMQKIGDSFLYSKWRALRGCETMTGCENAKKDFVASLNLKISKLEHELSQFVFDNTGDGTDE